jgi:hypothetical protein
VALLYLLIWVVLLCPMHLLIDLDLVTAQLRLQVIVPLLYPPSGPVMRE